MPFFPGHPYYPLNPLNAVLGVPVIERGSSELLSWEKLYNLDNMVHRACSRLGEIALNEDVLGYGDSAQMYRDTAGEIREAHVWLRKELAEALKALNSDT